MNLPIIITAVLAIILAAAGTAVYFRGSAGEKTIKLLQINIDAYKDSERIKDARIIYLDGQLDNANETIKNLNKALKK